ncbi:MAG TPA: WD40 repeat domain-containing protein, partial [Nannocystaceae bacterium]|nr:WD40 repeat domain-containing protein [Nannocystaceae bacterium]
TRALRRALSRAPADRFVSMDALLRELDPRTRTLRFVGAAAAALTIGTAGWLGVRAENFASEAANANERADTAELELRAREEAIVVGEANLELFRDPSAALRKLAMLPDDAVAWTDGAWQIAARAIDAGVPDRLLAVPAGFTGNFVLDEDRVVLRHGFDTAIWHIDSGLVDVIDPGEHDGVDFSDKATWVAIAHDDDLRIRHVDTGAEAHWALGECDASRFASDAAELALYCPTEDRSIVWNTPKGPDDPIVIREGGDAPYAGALDFHRSARRTVREISEDVARERKGMFGPIGATRVGRSFQELARRGLMAANVERTNADTSDPLVLWNMDTDLERTVTLPATPVTAMFSHAGDLLAVGVADGGIWLVDLRDPELSMTSFAKLDSGIVAELAFSDDGSELCGIAKDGTIVRWDVAHREERARLRGLAHAIECFWQDDGSFIALGTHEYRHYPAPTLRKVGEDVLQIAGAGDALATLHRRGQLEVAHDGRMIEVAIVPTAEELALAPNARWVATSGARSLEIREVETGALHERIETRNQTVTPLLFTEDSDTLVWLDRNAIQIHPMDGSAQRVVDVPGELFWGTPIVDGDMLLTTFAPPLDGNAELVTVDPERAEIVQRVPLSIRAVRRIAKLADGGIAVVYDAEALVVIERDGSVRWELRKEGENLLDVIALAGGRGIATIDFDGTIAIWDERTGFGYEVPFGPGHGTAVHGGRHRLEHGATLALDERDALWMVDRSGALARYRIDTPWAGPELASWVRTRSE